MKKNKDKLIFSIETSCDETSVAILDKNKKILSHKNINQNDHKKFGGVVPEIASRAHLDILQQIIPESLKEAGVKLKNIDVFCSTCGPGLIGGLLVGSTIAKSIAIGLKKPFYPINHLEGHILSSNFPKKLNFPNLTFLLTGGHTQIYLANSVANYNMLGETVDDAIGESFDKVAKLLGLNYPGGPFIEKLAINGNPNYYELPHPLKNKKKLSFSFSGIKTAVNLLIKKQNKIDILVKKNIAASFQNKIIEIINKRLLYALEYLENKKINIKEVAIVGGVAANKKINEEMSKILKKQNYKLISPPMNLCGDNAVIIANACLERIKLNIKPNINFKPNPRLTIKDL